MGQNQNVGTTIYTMYREVTSVDKTNRPYRLTAKAARH